jgi:hypothetical protein
MTRTLVLAIDDDPDSRDRVKRARGAERLDGSL